MTVGRDRAVDLLRGLLVVALALVEWLPPSPGYAWLRHSPWDGVRVADLVFPGFLFVVGASAAVARPQPWRRAVRRLVLLVLLGLVFNAFTTTSPLRLTGVLQTIGIAGFLAWTLTRSAHRVDDVLPVAGALLAVHGAVLEHAFAVDRWLFADDRLYRAGDAGHDPEGVLATVLGATALVLLGWASARLRSWPFAAGISGLALVAMLAWEPNKRAWTPTFTLLMAATFAVALLALRYVRLPALGAIGRNALLVYVGQHAVREMVDPAPDGNLLLFAVAAAATWSAAAVVLGRMGVRLRV